MLALVGATDLADPPSAGSLRRPGAARSSGSRARARAPPAACSMSLSPRSTAWPAMRCSSACNCGCEKINVQAVMATHDVTDALAIRAEVLLLARGPSRRPGPRRRSARRRARAPAGTASNAGKLIRRFSLRPSLPILHFAAITSNVASSWKRDSQNRRHIREQQLAHLRRRCALCNRARSAPAFPRRIPSRPPSRLQ